MLNITEKIKIDFKMVLLIIGMVIWFVRFESRTISTDKELQYLKEQVRIENQIKAADIKAISEKLDNISQQIHDMQGYIRGRIGHLK